MNAATLEFIHAHANDDVRQLALRRVPGDVNLREALTQIEGRQLAARKLPLLAATDGILYPPRLSLEQCSSEATAAYKREVVARLLKELPLGGTEGGPVLSFTDLTGGFGIDFMAISQLFDRATYVERDPGLCELARHNLPLMGCPHADVICEEVTPHSSLFTPISSPTGRGREGASSFILIDPARRDAAGRKVALIEDCTPDICALQELLRTSARYTLIKLSPMLDLTAALRTLEGIVEAHVISVDGECKELLLVMEGRNNLGERFEHSYLNTPIYCVDLKDHAATFRFTLAEERSAPETIYAPPSRGRGWGRVYEPNPSILKAGAFKTICQRFPVHKLAQHSHLYVSNTPIPDFPGRSWRIDDVSSFSKSDLRRLLAGVDAADLTVRGFPMSVASLRKQLHLREGGTTHLIATTLSDGTKILLKVSH